MCTVTYLPFGDNKLVMHYMWYSILKIKYDDKTYIKAETVIKGKE